ncbi:DMT family transporter [Treponema sp. C6A8]|uniref:DMT family transporter n=1 Tax=Treponema sp. C6A8 TaxID=1410609 RepID=UPI000480B6F8|nr:DMT family transporter [Treponema sp. C6A8]
MQNQKTQLKGVLILLVTAIIWGSSFVSQSVGAEAVEPFTFMAVRTLMGAAFLLPFVLVRDKISAAKMTKEELFIRKRQNQKTIVYGVLLGIVLAIATNIQQYAFNYSTAGKIAFVTAMYMFFVPIAGIFMKKRLPLDIWLCVLAGFVGLYFLCFKHEESFVVNKGDMLALICAVFFTVQILLIERYAKLCDGIKLSCIEFFTAGLITFILMLIFDHPVWAAIKVCAPALLYSGIMSCGIAYTLQIVGQKYCEATIASLLMCMESVFAVLSAAIILGEKLTPREITGCTIMFSAIVISQLADVIRAKKAKA